MLGIDEMVDRLYIFSPPAIHSYNRLNVAF
jgi:hypothetical protein